MHLQPPTNGMTPGGDAGAAYPLALLVDRELRPQKNDEEVLSLATDWRYTLSVVAPGWATERNTSLCTPK